MVLMGHKVKQKQKPIKEALARASSKMAAKAMTSSHRLSFSPLVLDDSEDEAPFDSSSSSVIHPAGHAQKDLLQQMEAMLQKALHQIRSLTASPRRFVSWVSGQLILKPE